jgi:hypothetical protein
MPGRIKYYRCKRGIGAMEMGRLLSLHDPRSYIRMFENEKYPTGHWQDVLKICDILKVNPEIVLDSYCKFLCSDYKTKLRLFRESFGCSRIDMDRLLGNCDKTYACWERGATVPSRKSVEKLQELARENGIDL